MNTIQLEAWVLRVVDQVRQGLAPEDSLVELKSQWPDPIRGARQIAAHANAARGSHILWIIGLDEARGVIGAGHEELANWHPQVQSCFDGVAPELFDLNVPVDGKMLTALLFTTDRAPYVVRNPDYGQPAGGRVEFEIPWREGRKIRTARRSDLIRILAPLVATPQIEALSSEVLVMQGERESEPGKPSFHWHLTASAYVAAVLETAVVIPFHKCEVRISDGKSWELTSWKRFQVRPPYTMGISSGNLTSRKDSLTIESSSSEVIIQGPGRIQISAEAFSNPPDDARKTELALSIKLFQVGSSFPIIVQQRLQAVLPQTNEKFFAKWAADAEFDKVGQ